MSLKMYKKFLINVKDYMLGKPKKKWSINKKFLINVKDYMLTKPRKKLDIIERDRAERLDELQLISISCNGYY